MDSIQRDRVLLEGLVRKYGKKNILDRIRMNEAESGSGKKRPGSAVNAAIKNALKAVNDFSDRHDMAVEVGPYIVTRAQSGKIYDKLKNLDEDSLYDLLEDGANTLKVCVNALRKSSDEIYSGRNSDMVMEDVQILELFVSALTCTLHHAGTLCGISENKKDYFYDENRKPLQSKLSENPFIYGL